MNKPTWKWSVLGIPTLAALAAGALFMGQGDQADDVPDASESAPPKVTPRVLAAVDDLGEPGKQRCAPEAGTRFAYELTTKEVTDIKAAYKSTGANALTLHGRAQLELEALESMDDRALVLARFAHFEHGGVARDHLVERPFLFYITQDCSVEGFAHHRYTQPQYARVQQALLADLSWSLSSSTAHKRADGFGSYTQRMQESAPGLMLKSFEDFQPWRKGADEFEHMRSGTARVQVAQGAAWFANMRLSSSYEGEQFTLTRQLMASYALPKEEALESASREQSDYIWGDFLPIRPDLTEPEKLTRAQRAAIKRAQAQSVDEALTEFTALASHPATPIQDTWPGLRTFLEAKPEHAGEVARRLRERELQEEARMPAFLALGRARTPQAKEALMTYIQDESEDSFERTRAILAILDRDDVGVDLANYFSSKAGAIASGEGITERTLARHSMLGVGALAGKNPADQEVRAVAIRTIKVGLSALQEPHDLRPVFNSIANVGDPELLSMVSHIPTHPDARMREAAAAVMRRMPPKESAQFLATWLEQETDSKVKLELYYNLDKQTFDAQEMTSERVLKLAIQDLQEEPGPLTRKAIVQVLARAKAQAPDDALGIEALFLEMIPNELHQRSGLYGVMAKEVDPIRLREVTIMAQRESAKRAQEKRGAPLRWAEEPAQSEPRPRPDSKEVGPR